MKKLLAIFVLSLTLPISAFAALYTWVDAKGVQHIDSTPPPKGARVLHADGEPDGGQVGNRGEAERRYPKVELYSTDWCPSCKRAKAYLQANRIPFTEYDVDSNAAAEKRWRQLNPAHTIPTAVIGGTKIVGFNQAAYETALGLRK